MFYFSGVNRPDLISLLAEQQAAGMVNAAQARQPRLVEAYRQYPHVQLVLDCNAMQRFRRRTGRDRNTSYLLDEAIDTYASVISDLSWRFTWYSSYDIIGDHEKSNWCYEQLLKRLANPVLAGRVLWIYQRGGDLGDLKHMASTRKRVGIGGMVPVLRTAGVAKFLQLVEPLGDVLTLTGATAHVYGLGDAQVLAYLASKPWFGSADSTTWLIAYRAMELLLASGEQVSATRLGLRLTRRVIAANNIQVTREWVDPRRTHQFSFRFTT